jgi:dihydrofolate reductase
MTISLIVAMSRNQVIGRDNALPWRLPADLARFKRLTMGHPLIAGRKTWEAIGRALPGREMIVVTRQPGYAAEGARVARSLDEALELAAGGRAADDEVFVGGGAEIYRQALPRAHRLYLTLLHEDIPGDTRFPPWDESEWRLVSREDHAADEKNPYPYSFLLYER